MANENKIEEIIRTSLENMRSMVDANTVIGDPYVTPGGVTVIPVSKVSVGFASGGVDYFGKQVYLAQSPQLYKQAMVAVYERVFEIAPVFRAAYGYDNRDKA